jgi:signal transduction histidine kinase
MINLLRTLLVPYGGRSVYLDEIRRLLTQRLAVVVALSGFSGIWWSLSREPFPRSWFGLCAALLAIGLLTLECSRTHVRVARYLLMLGVGGALLSAAVVWPNEWVLFLGVPLIFCGALLLTGGHVVATCAVATTAWLLALSGQRSYALGPLMLALAAAAIVAWLTVRTLYTAIEWAWTMQQRSDSLLAQARNHQAELSQTLKSLNASFAVLDRTQRELVAARKHAEEARRMKEQFAANISHELRTPLNLIMGFSELLYLSPEVYGNIEWTPTLRRDVAHIYHSGRHLLGMIDDILDLSRYEMAGFTLQREPTSLTPFLQSVGEIAADLFRNPAVQFHYDIPPDLPTLGIDRTRMRQVLLNLLKNAQRFTEAGSVRLSVACEHERVVIGVHDTGPGIPPEKQPLVFDEFYQADTSLRRSHEGAGLGLAISKRFVEAHGGQIWLASVPGGGSSFYFSLPHTSYTRSGMAHNAHPFEPPPPPTRPCLLVLDPDPTLAALIERYLGVFDVVAVSQATELRDAVTLHHAQAVIWNVMGDQLPPPLALPVPIIYCTLPSRVEAARALSVNACLSKPVMADQLLDQVRRLGPVRDVLIVDDDRGFVQYVERVLQSSGQAIATRRTACARYGSVNPICWCSIWRCR